jgi:hypothetical protein
MTAPVFLLESNNVTLPETVLAVAPSGTVYACDFYVTGAEDGAEMVGGYRLGRLVNVDHHAPTDRMARPVSSANLAIAHVGVFGVAGPGDSVVVNHTDCDSVLSSAILIGELAPEARFGNAAVAADHTGAENKIADLLQALDHSRDRDLSLRNLRLLLAERPVEPAAEAALADRRRKRERAKQAVADGKFRRLGGLAWAELDEAIDGEFFPALLPQAIVILVASPRRGCPGRWETKLRLGMAAPEGLSLHHLDLLVLDPHYGGRWNAGSNRRGGGTEMRPERYAEELARRLAERLALGPGRETRPPRGPKVSSS